MPSAIFPSTTTTGTGSNWIGKYPHLHLIHVIIDHNDNEIKSAIFSWLDVPRCCLAIKNRNMAEAHESNVSYLVANKWNDPNFLPVTLVKLDMHSDFAHPVPITFEIIERLELATFETVEEKVEFDESCIEVNHPELGVQWAR